LSAHGLTLFAPPDEEDAAAAPAPAFATGAAVGALFFAPAAAAGAETKSDGKTRVVVVGAAGNLGATLVKAAVAAGLHTRLSFAIAPSSPPHLAGRCLRVWK